MLAPIRIHLVKGIEVGRGNGPLGYVIHYRQFDPTHKSPSLRCTVRTVLCVIIRYPLELVEDSFRRGRCSCDVHSQGRSAPLGKERPCIDVHFPLSPLLCKIDAMMLASELGQKYTIRDLKPFAKLIVCSLLELLHQFLTSLGVGSTTSLVSRPSIATSRRFRRADKELHCHS